MKESYHEGKIIGHGGESDGHQASPRMDSQRAQMTQDFQVHII